MNYKIKYFFLQLKRNALLLPQSLLAICIVLAAVGIAAYVFIIGGAYSENQQKYKIGIVRMADDELLSLGIDLIQSVDDSRYMLTIEEYDSKKEAAAALRANEISAFVELTPEFVQSVDHLKNDVTANYYASSSQKGISGIVMDEVSAIASGVIVYSDAGILSMREFMRNMGYSRNEISDATNAILIEYLEGLLERNNLITTEEIGISSGLGTVPYYFTSLLLFVLLLLTFCGVSLWNAKKAPLSQFLSSKGVKSGTQVLCEYLAFFLLNLCTVALVLVVLLILSRFEIIRELFAPLQVKETTDVFFDEPATLEIFGAKSIFGLVGIETFLAFFRKMALTIALFAAMSFLLFECFTDSISRILVTFLAYIGMSYLSGFFYPISFFPEAVKKVTSFLPTGLSFKYFSASIQGADCRSWVGLMFVYITIFLVCAAIARKSKY